MNSEKLKVLIEDARIKKGISQRELAKETGISRSTLNDLGIISRNKNPKNRDNIFENESSRIKRNFNVLFDYFLQ
jgi:transcriptional regulator with XRE-family HTH domain